ncbi:3-hydroxyacyl-ACP dehydratase FabZ [Thermaurantiacus sp.]
MGAGARDIVAILSMLPHRFPVLLVDRVEELVPFERIRAVKAVTVNEPFFQGHFPARPVMPGVLLVEAMAQAAGILAIDSLGLSGTGKLLYFMSVEEAKFRKPVEPGCLVLLDVAYLQRRANVSKFQGYARLGEGVAAEARFTAMIADPPA